MNCVKPVSCMNNPGCEKPVRCWNYSGDRHPVERKFK